MTEQIVIVGPPRSGRTTMARLLKNHLEQKGATVFIRGPYQSAAGQCTTRTPCEHEGYDVIIHDSMVPENPNLPYRVIALSECNFGYTKGFR